MSVEHVVLVRDNGQCFRCGANVMGGLHDCHHRQEKGMGGSASVSDTPENRITLCGRGNLLGCHGYVHTSIPDAMKNGWLVSRWGDPEKVPVRHWLYGMVYLTPGGGIVLGGEEREEAGSG